MSEDGRNQLYDFAECYGGLQDTCLHMLAGAPGGCSGSGGASALQQTTLEGYSDLPAEIGGGSNLVEEYLYSSGLPHQDPPVGGSCSGTYHHRQGRQQYHHLDPPAFPMFPASNPHEPPPPPPDGTPSPASTSVLSDPLWAAQTGLFNQSTPAVGNSLQQWLPNEWGRGGFGDPFARGVAGGSVCDGEDAEGRVRQPASTMLGFGLRRGEREGRGSNNTERQRRGKMSEKFGVLRSLIPKPGGKHDKASILTEATDYIRELLRTIGHLRGLVEAKQRRTADKSRRPSAASDEAGMESSSSQHDPAGRPRSALLPRCSWLQRSYKDTSVDVRTVEDDVTIKVVRRTTADCLLLVSRALHDLRLELLHLAAANIGDSLVLVINSKIEKGSSPSASVIAKKIVEALEGTVLGSF
ncbi:hypothetical protein Taro_041342 [Colocasia esculenta]|uniref:BHLH domain-containing protein n=1 Tax=Colocasia esculenta TaxID=4460 RepID=A0A843WX11_COLES|nr:hypothetical protein [Colocasia esculenta]